MRTKLTLRLDEELIHRAKLFAKKRNKSVSQIVADYFASFGVGSEPTRFGSNSDRPLAEGRITRN